MVRDTSEEIEVIDLSSMTVSYSRVMLGNSWMTWN